MGNKNLTDSLKGYLTPRAKIVIDVLTSHGMDRDLAIIFLEKHWPDTEVYQLEEKEDGEM